MLKYIEASSSIIYCVVETPTSGSISLKKEEILNNRLENYTTLLS